MSSRVSTAMPWFSRTSPRPVHTVTPPLEERISWVDYAKGICIILVVMMHATNGVEWTFGEEGWMRPAVDFARPFRMPDFFLISGLFLSRTLHGPLRNYIDRKVVHFAYFYLLWLTIQQSVFELDLLMSDQLAFAKMWLKSLVEPVGSLWFVHMLAVFYVVTRLIRSVPVWVVLPAAFALQSLYQLDVIDTGWSVVDRFCNRYIYFYIGFALAPWIFRFAGDAKRNTGFAVLGLSLWAVGNWLGVQLNWHNQFLTSFVMGMLGAAAICVISSLLAERRWAGFLRYCGQNSIVIYLTFALALKVTEKVFLRAGLPLDSAGLASAIALAAGVGLPLIFHALVQKTPLNMLYVRPGWARLPQA